MTNKQNNKTLTKFHGDKKMVIAPEEYNRIWYGELTVRDFCTSHPSKTNIDKTATGIETYLSQRRRSEET